MIVLDASAAVLALLHDGNARRLLATRAIGVPYLADPEVMNALRGRVIRGQVAADVARFALDRWVRLGVRRFGAIGLLPRIWELRENLTAYDANYVALAEALACDLVTADSRLARAPGPTCAILVVRG